MFQDVNVKIQVRSYLNFDVDVLKYALFPWIITFSTDRRTTIVVILICDDPWKQGIMFQDVDVTT